MRIESTFEKIGVHMPRPASCGFAPVFFPKNQGLVIAFPAAYILCRNFAFFYFLPLIMFCSLIVRELDSYIFGKAFSSGGGAA